MAARQPKGSNSKFHIRLAASVAFRESDQQNKAHRCPPCQCSCAREAACRTGATGQPEPGMMHSIQSRLNAKRQAELVVGSVPGLLGALRCGAARTLPVAERPCKREIQPKG